ncbi:Hypothetical predicted protein [Drosophila guanche]|uniref:Uncharacterized protein n=1 Tax=Drosophila guanche TaxID=7266 RepID=A0A3B0JPU1_DROGU|nr:Hypothetical predicted protein [Drosophila guanche]
MGYYLRNQRTLLGLSDPEDVAEPEGAIDPENEEQHGLEVAGEGFEEEMIYEFNYEPNWNEVTLEDMIERGYSISVPILSPNNPAGSSDIVGAGCVPLRLTIDRSPDGRLEEECYAFHFPATARHLLTEVGVEPTEESVLDVSYGLSRAVNVRSPTSLTECPSRGPLVVGVVGDRTAGAVIGFGVGQLHPHPIIDENGDYTGLEWHPEVRGFSIEDDDESRRIVTEFIADAVIRLDEQNI